MAGTGSRRRWRPGAGLALVASLGMLPAGCVTETKTVSPQSATAKKKSHGKTPAASQRPTKTPHRGASVGERPNELEDPCATRLHQISGLLLTYYALNKHLPDRLEELS